MNKELTNYTVLVVDDDAAVRNSLNRVLSCFGVHVLLAESAQEGWEVLARHSVECIISDHRMPGCTGTEFLAQVREKYPDVVRIMLTGNADEPTSIDAISRAKLFRFLTKPWDNGELESVLESSVQERKLLHAVEHAKHPRGTHLH